MFELHLGAVPEKICGKNMIVVGETTDMRDCVFKKNELIIIIIIRYL